MMFVFLFGISMDYHVFILSRVRELWAGGSPPKEAVVGGIASSAGVVTSAALIMVAALTKKPAAEVLVRSPEMGTTAGRR